MVNGLYDVKTLIILCRYISQGPKGTVGSLTLLKTLSTCDRGKQSILNLVPISTEPKGEEHGHPASTQDTERHGQHTNS